jgi:peptidyl-prolyl cis-trans isomerase A (cyclophilin A)
MTQYFSLTRFSQHACAVALLASLAACGGGGDSSAPATPTPKPNPVTTAPTLNCSADGTAASNASTATVTVCMLTSSGEIVLALDPVKAPVTVANFLKYVTNGFYNNTIIHRVEPGFVIQGGGYVTGRVLKTGTLAPIALESQNGLSNLRGTIAMARTNAPNSATSQFFFNTLDNLDLNYNSAAQPGYAVFGRVISGSATLDAINAQPVLLNATLGVYTPATEVLVYWAKQLK